jgi:AhpD family alkylhydroperoxidase
MVLPAIPLQYSLTMEGEYVVKMRLEPAKVSPAAYHAMLGLERFVKKSSKLELSLLELVNIRASQINRCAFSIDLHSKDARVNGETSSVSTSCLHGEKRASLPTANARLSLGPKR